MMACNGKLPLALIICSLYTKKRGKAADFAREFDKSTQQEIALYTDKKNGKIKEKEEWGVAWIAERTPQEIISFRLWLHVRSTRK